MNSLKGTMIEILLKQNISLLEELSEIQHLEKFDVKTRELITFIKRIPREIKINTRTICVLCDRLKSAIESKTQDNILHNSYRLMSKLQHEAFVDVLHDYKFVYDEIKTNIRKVFS